jgi:hypothetical protein
MCSTRMDVEHIDHICYINLINHTDHIGKMVILKKCRTHRYDHISLLHFCPGEVLQELVARHAAKVETSDGKLKSELTYFSYKSKEHFGAVW